MTTEHHDLLDLTERYVHTPQATFPGFWRYYDADQEVYAEIYRSLITHEFVARLVHPGAVRVTLTSRRGDGHTELGRFGHKDQALRAMLRARSALLAERASMPGSLPASPATVMAGVEHVRTEDDRNEEDWVRAEGARAADEEGSRG